MKKRYFVILNDGTDEIYNLNPRVTGANASWPKAWVNNKSYYEVESLAMMEAILLISNKTNQTTAEDNFLNALEPLFKVCQLSLNQPLT